MKWYYNLKISVKLLSGFVLVALIAGIVGYIGITGILSTNKNYSDLFEQFGIALGDIGDASTDFQMIRNLTKQVVLEKGNNSEKYIDTIKQFDKKLDDSLALFQKNIKTSEVQNEHANLLSLITRYRSTRDKIINLAVANQQDKAIALMNSDGIPIAELAEKSFEKLVDSKKVLGRQKSAEYATAVGNSVILMVIVILIAVIAAIILGFFISRIIGKPVKKLAEAANRLSAGDIEVDLKATTSDEIGSLTASFEKLIENIREQAEAANKIASGDLSTEMNVKSDKDILSKSIKQVVETLRSLINEMDHMSKEHDLGDTDIFVMEDKFHGAYKTMAQGVNNMVKGHIGLNKKAMACVAEFSKGN
ncbi:MAG TPA: MCP four helix bundle domain-containing protein, partial [Clostridia bacterium]